MMSRWTLTVLSMFWIALMPTCGLGEPPAQAPPDPAAAPPASVTQSFGTLPANLVGTWLATLQTQTTNGLVNNWHIYKISRDNEAWRLQRYERPHVPQLDALAAAAGKEHKELVPTPETLAAIKEALPKATLLPEAQTFRAVVLRDAGSFPAESPPQSKDAKFSIELLDQNTGNVVSAVQFYVKDAQADRLMGDTHAVTITAAGLGVVPIEMAGQFKMYRLQ